MGKRQRLLDIITRKRCLQSLYDVLARIVDGWVSEKLMNPIGALPGHRSGIGLMGLCGATAGAQSERFLTFRIADLTPI
jgi:hypothetical protein